MDRPVSAPDVAGSRSRVAIAPAAATSVMKTSSSARPAGPRCVHATAVNASAANTSKVAPVQSNTLRTRSTSHSCFGGAGAGRATAGSAGGEGPTGAAPSPRAHWRPASSFANASRRAHTALSSVSAAASRAASERSSSASPPCWSNPHEPHQESPVTAAPQAGHCSWSPTPIGPPAGCGLGWWPRDQTSAGPPGLHAQKTSRPCSSDSQPGRRRSRLRPLS